VNGLSEVSVLSRAGHWVLDVVPAFQAQQTQHERGRRRLGRVSSRSARRRTAASSPACGASGPARPGFGPAGVVRRSPRRRGSECLAAQLRAGCRVGTGAAGSADVAAPGVSGFVHSVRGGGWYGDWSAAPARGQGGRAAGGADRRSARRRAGCAPGCARDGGLVAVGCRSPGRVRGGRPARRIGRRLGSISDAEKLATVVQAQWLEEIKNRRFNDPTRNLTVSGAAADRSLTVGWDVLVDQASRGPGRHVPSRFAPVVEELSARVVMDSESCGPIAQDPSPPNSLATSRFCREPDG
jgi:hypothetical protein